MILNTPYLHVQAIRRRYRDQGKPTVAKPATYGLTLNLPTTTVNSQVTRTLAIDADSDFIWLSTYYWKDLVAWEPNITTDGEVPDRPNNVELRIELLNAGRLISHPAFMPALPFDWGSSGLAFGGTVPECETIDGGLANQDDFGILRSYLPEPIVLAAGERVQCTLRVREFDTTSVGNVLLFSGVRLFTGG